MKKLLAVLLSLCLVVGMLPMMAFATDDEITTPTPPTETETTETPQTNYEDSGQEGQGNQEGTGGQKYPGGQGGGDQGDGKQDRTGDPGYNPSNIQNFEQLKAALGDGLTNIPLGARIDLTTDLTIGDGVIITGAADEPGRVFAGNYKLTINGDVTFNYVGIDASIVEVVVNEGCTLTVNDATVDSSVEISGEGKVVVDDKTIYPKSDPGEDDDGDDDTQQPPETVPAKPVYYSVSFDVTPYWADVVVTDSTGNTVKPDRNGQYWLEAGKEYDYTVSAYGFISETGDIGLTNAIKVKLDQSDKVVVWPTSHGDVYFSYLRHGVVAVYVEPDSGYYLDDLTIYRVGYGAIDYGKWDNGVYYFRMKPGAQYIIDADFASAPSEYRVYVDSSILHGDVSVDTVYAEEGEWVYITVDPDVGYRLYNLTVTRPSGNTVKVEHVRDNVYRFSMPGVRVTVDAEFIRTVTPFTDVRLADWFYEYVSFAYRYGLMEGINSYQFAPDATATRAMVVQILYRMSGEPAVSYGSGFTDVASNAWYADAIAWAARNNIVNGTSAATFDPNAPVTREQFATMLYRYARYRGFNTSLTANILSYYDVNQVSEYAFEALQWACAEGIVNGTSTGYLTPQGNATRAQLAAMLMRFCNEYFDL